MLICHHPGHTQKARQAGALFVMSLDLEQIKPDLTKKP